MLDDLQALIGAFLATAEFNAVEVEFPVGVRKRPRAGGGSLPISGVVLLPFAWKKGTEIGEGYKISK